MVQKVALYWPGEYVSKPNELAVPQLEHATAQLEKALGKLGRPVLPGRRLHRPSPSGHRKTRSHRRSHDRGSMSTGYGVRTPSTARPARTPPLLLASNFNRRWPGPGRSPQYQRLPGKRRTAAQPDLDRRRGLVGRRRLHGPAGRMVRNRPHRLSGRRGFADRGRVLRKPRDRKTRRRVHPAPAVS